MLRMTSLLLLLAAACGPTISTVATNPAPRPLTSRPPSTVELFTTQRPPWPYVEVAVFSASKGKAEEHIEALRDHAAAYGCDGLVFTVMPSDQQVAVTSQSMTPGEPSTQGYGNAVHSSSATCVVRQEPAIAPPGGAR
jgi:hypothetical protein